MLKNNSFCGFCGKIIESDKVRDHCHLTGRYVGPAHSKGNINTTQKQNNFVPFIFHYFKTMIVICSSKSWLIKRNIM